MTEHLPSNVPRLSDLRIRGFRGIGELTIPRLGRVTLLAGRNGVGKTTVLDAVRLHAARGHRFALAQLIAHREGLAMPLPGGRAAVAPLDFGTLFHRRYRDDAISIRIGPVGDGEELRIEGKPRGQGFASAEAAELANFCTTQVLEVAFLECADSLYTAEFNEGWIRNLPLKPPPSARPSLAISPANSRQPRPLPRNRPSRHEGLALRALRGDHRPEGRWSPAPAVRYLSLRNASGALRASSSAAGVRAPRRVGHGGVGGHRPWGGRVALHGDEDRQTAQCGALGAAGGRDPARGSSHDVIEHQLAHAVRDPNGRAYNRTAFLPERRVMQAWADYWTGSGPGTSKPEAASEGSVSCSRTRHSAKSLSGDRKRQFAILSAADQLVPQMTNIDNSSKTDKHALETRIALAPIHHRTRHRRSLASFLAVLKKPQPRVVEERDTGRCTEDVTLPMPRVGRHWHQGQHLRTVSSIALGTPAKPITNRCASLLIPSVGRIDEDGRIVPRFDEAVRRRKRVFDCRSND